MTGLRAHPLLVFSHAYLQPAISRRDGVIILPSPMLGRYLQQLAGTIPNARVSHVYDRLAAVLSA